MEHTPALACRQLQSPSDEVWPIVLGTCRMDGSAVV